MDHYTKLRSQIRAGRELLELKQSDLAEALGVSLSKVSRAESGETKSGDTLLELKAALERMGIRFSSSGVEVVEDHIEVFEGNDCYNRLLDDVHQRLKGTANPEFLVMFSVEETSPEAINERYNRMMRDGLTFRKLIADNNDYIMGPLDWYRTMPAKYFSNVVTVIYGDRVAQHNGRGDRVIVYENDLAAARDKQIFSYLWNMGQKPQSTTSKVRYEQK